MTEQDWLECTAPEWLLSFLHGKASERKLRLFACACCRQAWGLLADPRSRNAVEVAERFADGLATREDLRAARAGPVHPRFSGVAAEWVYDSTSARHHSSDAAKCLAFASAPTPWKAAFKAARLVQTQLLRCMIANPFRSVVVNPAWRSYTVGALAQAAYEDRVLPSGQLQSDRLAVLADALEDAGCDSADILGHLREQGPHVRGCWAVDLVLARV